MRSPMSTTPAHWPFVAASRALAVSSSAIVGCGGDAGSTAADPDVMAFEPPLLGGGVCANATDGNASPARATHRLRRTKHICRTTATIEKRADSDRRTIAAHRDATTELAKVGRERRLQVRRLSRSR